VSGVEAQAVFAASQAMASDAFVAALEALRAEAPGAQRGPRVVLAGSGQPTPALHRVVEGAGGVVVGDFHEFGEPMAGPPIPEGRAPLRAIVEHYHRHVASSRTFPQVAGRIVDFVQAARAEAVIFYYPFEEEALTWEYPAQRDALHQAGVATLCFESIPARLLLSVNYNRIESTFPPICPGKEAYIL
jgi:hypothetical protein